MLDFMQSNFIFLFPLDTKLALPSEFLSTPTKVEMVNKLQQLHRIFLRIIRRDTPLQFVACLENISFKGIEAI